MIKMSKGGETSLPFTVPLHHFTVPILKKGWKLVSK
jgi:hypothetical protein